MTDDSQMLGSAYEEMDGPDHETMEAKALLVRQMRSAIESRSLTLPEVGRIVGVTVDEVHRVLSGRMRSYSVGRLGAWLDWIVTGRGIAYSDEDPNYGEDISSPVVRWIEDASARANALFVRLRKEARGRVHPLRYEALLRRMEHIVIELGGEGASAAFAAERRMSEVEDDLAAVLVASSEAVPAAANHVYREDEEGYAEYGLGVEDMLLDTSTRLERLRRRLHRRLRGRLGAEEYEAVSGRIARATVEYRGRLHEAKATAERAVLELRAEIDARVAELDAAENGDWLERIAAERRAASPTYAEAERRVEDAGGGYEVHRMTDGEGRVLPAPDLVAQEDVVKPLPIEPPLENGT